MIDSETAKVIARLLSERLVQLGKEGKQWAPDPFEPKPAVTLRKGIDMLEDALNNLIQSTSAIERECNKSLNNMPCESTGMADMSAIEEAVARILAHVRAIYRVEFRLAQVTPPRLLENCFRLFQGIGHRFAGKLNNAALDINQKAEGPFKTGVIYTTYTLGFEPNEEQLVAEFNRVRDVIREVGQLKR